MTTIVLGASGQLANHLQQQLPQAAFWGRATVDISDPTRLHEALLDAAPRAIVNAAAYTAVDKAEQESELAWRMNAEAPAAAARAAATLGATIVQVSTDYVFDGRATVPYTEDAPVNPLGVYGASKLGGELAVRTLCPRHWILRTSWVFSEHGANFVKTMLRLATGGRPLRIVADQQGQPTYAGDLAALIGALDGTGAETALPFGTYHATGGPVVSWHGFAARIVERAAGIGLLENPVRVDPIATAEYPTPAQRPTYGALRPSAALTEVVGAGFDWQAGLETALAAIAKATAATQASPTP